MTSAFADLDSLRSSSSGPPSVSRQGTPLSARDESDWPENSVPLTVKARSTASGTALSLPRYRSDAQQSHHPSVIERSSSSRLSLIDTTGDGRPNLVGIDSTGDGKVDSLAIDTTGDGRCDRVCSAGADPSANQVVDTSSELVSC